MSPDLLSPHAEAVARRVLAEEAARRRHVVVALTGAHAFGFASPDSDLDLKAIHQAPTRALLGLRAVSPTHDRMEVLEGVEIDYTSNELGLALAAMLKGNGNFLERVLGPHVLLAGPEFPALVELARSCVSRRVHRHYRGFATGQLHEFDKPEGGTAKKALYVLRTTLTGAHALRTGEIDPDVTHHLSAYGFEDASDLLEVKRRGERTPLPQELRTRWRTRLEAAFTILDHALAASPLPEAPPPAVEAACEAWLVETRRADLA